MFKKIVSWLSAIALTMTLSGCNDTIDSVQAFSSNDSPIPKVENIAEVAPPKLIQELGKNFVSRQPQVKIVSPQKDQILTSTTAEVKIELQDLPIFKNEELAMGPHLHFFLDDQPYQALYNVDEPLILEDLEPGTHTIRVFASRPWHESFKNQGAYAQTTFHVFTSTEDNNPSPNQPLLTYSRPQGNYSAEPIMLDFYLTNAPLHLVAQENSEDNINDWRIRVTINGETFLLDTWQPIYLTGFNKGQNWVKLEFIDDQGNVIKNAFNSTVRVINYNPRSKDTLGKLVTGKISANKAKVITISDYQPEEETLEEEVVEEETPMVEEKVNQKETVEEEVTQIEEKEEEQKPEAQNIVQDEPITEETPEDVDIVEEILETIVEEETITDNTPENNSPTEEKSVKDTIIEDVFLPSTQPEESVETDVGQKQ